MARPMWEGATILSVVLPNSPLLIWPLALWGFVITTATFSSFFCLFRFMKSGQGVGHQTAFPRAGQCATCEVTTGLGLTTFILLLWPCTCSRMAWARALSFLNKELVVAVSKMYKACPKWQCKHTCFSGYHIAKSMSTLKWLSIIFNLVCV